jgi:hypothetical protein
MSPITIDNLHSPVAQLLRQVACCAQRLPWADHTHAHMAIKSLVPAVD